MNVELWNQVKQHILEEPNRLIMSLTVSKSSDIYDAIDGFGDTTRTVNLRPPCGTAACIAGWTCILGHPEIETNEQEYAYDSIKHEAARLLDVSSWQMNEIYLTRNWDADLREKFRTTDLKVRAEAAVEMMDRFQARVARVG